jgi:hypothetical protein
MNSNVFNVITRTNLIHFTYTFILLKLKASTSFGHHLHILRSECEVYQVGACY